MGRYFIGMADQLFVLFLSFALLVHAVNYFVYQNPLVRKSIAITLSFFKDQKNVNKFVSHIKGYNAAAMRYQAEDRS